jgi:hypothetical protein
MRRRNFLLGGTALASLPFLPGTIAHEGFSVGEPIDLYLHGGGAMPGGTIRLVQGAVTTAYRIAAVSEQAGYQKLAVRIVV